MDSQEQPGQPQETERPLPQIMGALQPVVLKPQKKKKKYKYSKGLKDIQRTGRRTSKVSSRLARSVVKGMEAYRKASDKSARKKRDGAIRDFGLNVAKGTGKSLRAASRLPYDFAKAFDQRGTRRLIRRQVKAAARMGKLLRIR